MFNHIRTLLLNKNGAKQLVPDSLGEELVPKEYRAINLPSSLDKVRQILFGTEPDRSMLNYRLHQYLTIIEASDLRDYQYQFDSRITYQLNQQSMLFASGLFHPEVFSGRLDAGTLHIQGEPLSPDKHGKLHYRYEVTAIVGGTIRVKSFDGRYDETHDFIPQNGLSEKYTLGATGYTFYVSPQNSTEFWVIEGYLRPKWDIGQIVLMLEKIGEPVLLDLFTLDNVEPFNTFRNIWRDHPETVYRISAVVLALAYRTEQIRVELFSDN